MIVINKRYYDYDYDNNTIIMFDAEDESDSAMQMASNPLVDKKGTHSSSISAQLESSQSTETVPDELLMFKSSSIAQGHATDSAANDNSNSNSNQNQEALHSPRSAEEKETDSGIGSVSWISSVSPKGSRRIPYAIQIAHSYTINKLEVQLTTLVDVKTLQKQHQEQLQALQQQQYEYQLALQREHEALIAKQQQYEFQQRYYRGPRALHQEEARAQALEAQARAHAQSKSDAHRNLLASAHALAAQARHGHAPGPGPAHGHVAMHPAHVHAPPRPRYPPSRELAGSTIQYLPDGVAYVGPRAQPRYPPPRPGHAMRPVMVQKDRYHTK